MTNKNNNENSEELVKTASKRLGIDPDRLKESVQNGDLSGTLKNLSLDDAKKVEKVLNDKNAAEKLLSTPKARELLRKFLGGK